jgi:hypothetical protein
LAVKASCPKCGKELEATNLAELKRSLRNCCKGARKKKRERPSVYNDIQFALPFEVHFGRLIHSQNISTYAHWSVPKKDKDDWQRRVNLAFRDYRGVLLPWSSWEIRRIYAHPNRRMDYANMVGGCKPLIDALIDCHIIVDDADKYFECSYEQDKGVESYTWLILKECRYGDPS